MSQKTWFIISWAFLIFGGFSAAMMFALYPAGSGPTVGLCRLFGCISMALIGLTPATVGLAIISRD